MLDEDSYLSRRELSPWADDEKPVVDMHICTVAFDIRSKASRHASAGGHFSIRSPRTEVAARIVKSTSSIVCHHVLVQSPKQAVIGEE